MKLFLICLLIQLTGCATYTTMMQHPETKEVHRCSEFGLALLGMWVAYSRHDECVKAFEDIGFISLQGAKKD